MSLTRCDRTDECQATTHHPDCAVESFDAYVQTLAADWHVADETEVHRGD